MDLSILYMTMLVFIRCDLVWDLKGKEIQRAKQAENWCWHLVLKFIQTYDGHADLLKSLGAIYQNQHTDS